MELEHINGKDKGKILLFALSTCGWCKKVRMLLEDLEIAYDFIYVDLTSGDERTEAVNALKEFNNAVSFPTLIINNENVIIGFEEEKIRSKIG